MAFIWGVSGENAVDFPESDALIPEGAPPDLRTNKPLANPEMNTTPETASPAHVRAWMAPGKAGEYCEDANDAGPNLESDTFSINLA